MTRPTDAGMNDDVFAALMDAFEEWAWEVYHAMHDEDEAQAA